MEKKAPAFDLAQYELTDTATLTIETPKGDEMLVEGKPVKITVYGPGSKQFNKAKHVYESAASARTFAAMRNKPAKNAAELAQKDLAEFLAACTLSIDNFPIDALEIYSNPRLKYITDQVNTFLGDTENFMPAS